MNYEYSSYQTSGNHHHHDYIIPPLLSLIDETKSNNEKNTRLRILDLGCGNGSLTSYLVDQGYEMVGVEESKLGIDIAHENFPKCKFIQGSIYDMPYDQLGERFDLVIAIDVIEHLFYPKELIRSAQKCLKANGSLIITTPYHGYLKNLALAILGKMDGHFTVLWDGGHIKFFSVVTLRKLLESEGASSIKFKFAGGLPFIWKNMICFSTFT